MTGQGDHRMKNIRAGMKMLGGVNINLQKRYRTVNQCTVRGLRECRVDTITDEKGNKIYSGMPKAVVRGEVHFADRWTQTFWDREGKSLILTSPNFDLVEHKEKVSPQTQMF